MMYHARDGCGLSKQRKKSKTALKRYKNFAHFRMLIAVPDGQRNRSKKEGVKTINCLQPIFFTAFVLIAIQKKILNMHVNA